MNATTIDAPCTCNSGLPIRDCCFVEFDTRPPGPQTNYSHPRCYARALNDCSPKITSEHYFSEGVLELLGAEVELVVPSGKRVSMRPNAVAANILCERHNTALSPLDSLAKRFFEVVLRKTTQKVLVIKGVEFERWLFKFMWGAIAAGVARSQGKLIPARTPPTRILRILYSGRPVLTSGGLIVWARTKDAVVKRSHIWGVSCDVMAQGSFVDGCALDVAYVGLFFGLNGLDLTRFEGARLVRRPECVTYQFADDYREVHFGWPEGEYLRVDVSTTTQGR